MRHIATWLLAAGVSTLAWAGIEPDAATAPSAAQIVERNVAARGGLEAWQHIQTMVWVGHVQSASGTSQGMPFMLELKRPDKTRFEVTGEGSRSVRAFDGRRGWKLRAGSDGQPQVRPYSPQEVKFAEDAGGIDGPLIDYQAKGIAVALDGVDSVAGRKAYRLNVTLPSGAVRHVWVDAESFLDIKYDRPAETPGGRSATVAVYYRDFQTFEGVRLPTSIETSVDGAPTGDKMVIERVSLNPPLQDRAFAAPTVPGVPHAGRGVAVDIPVPPTAGQAFRRGGEAPAPLSRLLARPPAGNAP